MDFADLDVRDPRSRARWHKSSSFDRDHLMALSGKELPRPSPYAAAHKNKARNAHSCTCDQAREAKSDPEGEDNRPRRASWHLDGLSWALFRIPNIHHDLPSNEVHDRKHCHPHRVYEVPIESNHAKTFTLPRVNPTEEGEDEGRGKEK